MISSNSFEETAGDPLPAQSGEPSVTGHCMTRLLIALNPFSAEPPKPFLPWIIVRYLIVILAVSALLSPLSGSGRPDLAGMTPANLIVSVVFLSPIIETFLFQALFCGLARRLRLRSWWQVAVTMLPFAAAHFFYGLCTGLQAGVVLGYFLSYVYVTQRRTSFIRAISWTSLFHMLNNGVIILIILLRRR
jgi:hypothetical protein